MSNLISDLHCVHRNNDFVHLIFNEKCSDSRDPSPMNARIQCLSALFGHQILQLLTRGSFRDRGLRENGRKKRRERAGAGRDAVERS
jgi:hypothetical protein